MSTSTVTRSIRLPEDLAAAVDSDAAAAGLTFTEFAIAALRNHVGWSPSALPMLFEQVRDHLDAAYGADFPIDVTRKVFLHIQADPALLHTYNAAVAEHSAKAVNQRLGKLVKEHLGATVIGNSPPIEGELIVTHALLTPA